MSVIYDVRPTREQLIQADNEHKAWVSDSYLMCNGYQLIDATYDDHKSYNWFKEVEYLKQKMKLEGYIFKVDLLY